MATTIQRQRIRPMWNGGLRRGKIRDTMTAYLANHPEFLEDLRRIDRQLAAWGVEPMSMKGVRQPFDYPPRTPSRACEGSCAQPSSSR
jgi:hypothetical protein